VPREANDKDYDIDVLAGRLVGARISGVRYWDTPCFGELPQDEWPSPGPHGAGHGVDLILDDGVVGVTWGREDLQIWPFSLVDLLLSGRFEAVNEKPPWSLSIGREITLARVHRLRGETGGRATSFPFALELRFAEDGLVVFAAASYHGPGGIAFPGGDDIVIAWHPDHFKTVLPDLVEPLQIS
jgi:hypothetical protein